MRKHSIGSVLIFMVLFSAAWCYAADGEGTFQFGSYGRVQPSTDLEGGSGRHTNVVSHGSRLEQESYTELDFVYDFKNEPGVIDFQFVSTIGIGESLFHNTGAFSMISAVRNLFIRADHVVWKPLSVWAGSRMYRGDDVYLFDFWPLDEVNLYGGGLKLVFSSTEAALHVGFNRLESDWSFQELEVPSDTFGTQKVRWMERQRLIAGATATQYFLKKEASDFFLKLKLFAEFQHIGEGTRIARYSVNAAEQTDEVAYPSDFGWSVGAQFGVNGLGKNGNIHVFGRFSGGLAAYGTLAEPYGFNTDRKTTSALELLGAITGNLEVWKLAIQFGSYIRSFKDADPNKYDNDDYLEYIFAVRPHLMLHENFYLAAELSHQLRRPNGLDAAGEKGTMPMVTKLTVMPLITTGGGSLGRPQLRLVYTASFLNEDAQVLLGAADTKKDAPVQHFLGLSAEWWFNTDYR